MFLGNVCSCGNGAGRGGDGSREDGCGDILVEVSSDELCGDVSWDMMNWEHTDHHSLE